MDLNPKYLESLNKTVNQANRATNYLSNVNVRGKLGAIAGVGAAMGLGKTLTDDIDDDITTAIPNVATGAGVAVGGTYGARAAARYIQGGEDSIFTSDAGKGDTSQSVASDIAKRRKQNETITSGDMAQDMVDDSIGPRKYDAEKDMLIKEHKRTDAQQASTDVTNGNKKTTVGSMPNELSEADAEKMKKFRRVNKGFRAAGAVGVMAFGAATVLDIQQRIDEGRRVDDMLQEQERSLVKKDKEETAYKRSQGYGNIDLGDMVSQLFDERIGHHKMGNAKFQ